MHKRPVVAGCCAIALTTLLVTGAEAQFNPVGFPADVGVAGFAFPVPSATIDAWVQGDDIGSIAAHAWGLWVGVNMDSGQVSNGQNLRVFETWNEKGELSRGPSAKAEPRSLSPTPLRQFRFQNGRMLKLESIPAGSPLGFVKFDPTAADFIISKNLRSQQTLDSFLVPGRIGNVPDLPNTAISVKVPAVAPVDDPLNPGFFKFTVWPGPPAAPTGFGQEKWNTFVWVDLNPNNPRTGDGSVAHGSEARTPGNTYSIADFINFRDASGQTRIVTGMHMTTREIARWTWQTFWWTPDAAKPPAPSSTKIADARPPKLLTMGPPAHYAASLAYSMRTASGDTVFAYNPYLEAGFVGLSGNFTFGVQTNCMSCHANATHPGFPDMYVGNENVDIAGSQFFGQVRLDFLYSLEP